MQPFTNPNYFQYQNPYQQPTYNPTMERLNALQAYQQSLQQPQQQIPMLNGRVVDNFDTITANDVPMSGNAVFIKSDGSEIQVRAWGKMGSIEKVSYKPQIDTETTSTDKLTSEVQKIDSDAFSAFTDGIMKRFDEFDKQLSDFGKCLTTKSTSKTKKEADAE